jgi:hypothetical protein
MIVSISLELCLPYSTIKPSISTTPSFSMSSVSLLQASVQVCFSISWANCFFLLTINIAKQVQLTLASSYQQCHVFLLYILKFLWKMGYLHSCRQSLVVCVLAISNIWWWPSFRSTPWINSDSIAWFKRFFILIFWAFSFFNCQL